MIEQLAARLAALFSTAHLSVWLTNGIVNVLLASLAYGAFHLAWMLLKRFMLPRLVGHIDATSAAMVAIVVKSLCLGLGALAALSAAGIQTTAVLTSLGVLSLTIGFALRDTLSNIISGFLVFIDRPFTIGDLVEIDGQYGRVDRITLRTTRIVTVDGRMLAVPNAVVMNKSVTSYTNFPHLRIDIAVSIGLEENIERVRALLLDLVRRDPDYLAEPPPRVVVVALNDYNIALELQAWLRNERTHVQKRFDLREAVYVSLTAAGVDMPLETVEMRQVLKTVNGAPPGR